MAPTTISKSPEAPNGTVSFSFGEHEGFLLDEASPSYTTENPSVIGDARVHPWLVVDAPADEPVAGPAAVVEPVPYAVAL